MTDQMSHIVEGQKTHIVLLAVLLVAVYLATGLTGALHGSFAGLSSSAWLWLVLADAIFHQFYVWFCWRMELHGQHLTRYFGQTMRAFNIYAIGFSILFIARFFLIIAVGYANRGTWMINPSVGYGVAILIAVPALYLFYSVRVFFGFQRAFGIDHFVKEARNWPIVRKGIFRFTPNAMYVFGIGALWIPAFAFQSLAALIAAGFSHVYIWVHYFTVEEPDMRQLYGGGSDAKGDGDPA